MRYTINALLLCAATLAHAGPDWHPVEGRPGIYALRGVEVMAFGMDTPPHPEREFLCVKGPKEILGECQPEHGRYLHLTLEGAEEIDTAKLAVATGVDVIMHVDTNELSENMRGYSRCNVARLVVPVD